MKVQSVLMNEFLDHRAVGKNQPLKKDRPKWKSDVPLTEGQLRSKRDEFWDTAPAFDGRKEIWDALKAAAYASESRDFALAQAIIDGACISLPSGSLLDSYDELGNRYQLPVYCISAPINLIQNQDSLNSSSDSPSPESEPYRPGTAAIVQRPAGEEIVIKFRISALQNDIKMSIFTKESVLHAKHRLALAHGFEASDQRWYFGGRLLHDKVKFEEIKLQPGFVIQVVIRMR